MIIKIGDKEYSFEGYVNPINSVQKLAGDIYQQGRADAIDETINRLKHITNKDVVIIEKANLDDIARELKEQNKC